MTPKPYSNDPCVASRILQAQSEVLRCVASMASQQSLKLYSTTYACFFDVVAAIAIFLHGDFAK